MCQQIHFSGTQDKVTKVYGLHSRRLSRCRTSPIGLTCQRLPPRPRLHQQHQLVWHRCLLRAVLQACGLRGTRTPRPRSCSSPAASRVAFCLRYFLGAGKFERWTHHRGEEAKQFCKRFLGMCKVCTEAVDCVALWTRVTLGLGMCKVCTEEVDCVALWTRVTLGLDMCKVCNEAVHMAKSRKRVPRVSKWTKNSISYGDYHRICARVRAIGAQNKVRMFFSLTMDTNLRDDSISLTFHP